MLIEMALMVLQSLGTNTVPQAHHPPAAGVYSRKPLLTRTTVAKASGAIPLGDTPDKVRGFYGIPRDRGSKTIAVVIPFHYPNPGIDLDRFSAQFKLRKCNSKNRCLHVVAATGISCTWAREAALSLQWAHAVAPRAHLLLVEAASAAPEDLFPAIARASYEVRHAGGGEVVLPWALCGDGTCERPDDRQKYDQFFVDGVVYFAAVGDQQGTPSYPSTSSKVVAVGGTIPSDIPGNDEVAWENTGGGKSLYVPKPAFQQNIENTPESERYTPDLAVSARTVAVYFTSPCPGQISSGWQAFQGGTSAAAPIAAGMVNAAGHFNTTSQAELAVLYANRADTTRFRDIVTGSSGANSAGPGYDTVSGIGAPLGTEFDAPPKKGQAGKSRLATHVQRAASRNSLHPSAGKLHK